MTDIINPRETICAHGDFWFIHGVGMLILMPMGTEKVSISLSIR